MYSFTKFYKILLVIMISHTQ